VFPCKERFPLNGIEWSIRSPDEEEDEKKERDVAAVFPTESRKFKTDALQQFKNSVAERFITETEVVLNLRCEIKERKCSSMKRKKRECL